MEVDETRLLYNSISVALAVKSLDLSLLDNGQGNAWPERYRLSRFLGRFALPGRTIDNFSAFWLIRC